MTLASVQHHGRKECCPIKCSLISETETSIWCQSCHRQNTWERDPQIRNRNGNSLLHLTTYSQSSCDVTLSSLRCKEEIFPLMHMSHECGRFLIPLDHYWILCKQRHLSFSWENTVGQEQKCCESKKFYRSHNNFQCSKVDDSIQ